MRADARRNRERLLQAATALFAERGPGVPLDDVARRAGVGPGTLHRHFPTKEALLAAAVADRVEATAADGRALVERPDTGAALADMIRLMVAAGRAEEPLKAVLAADGVDPRTTAPEAGAAVREVVATLLARAQDAGAVRADLDAADVMGLVAGLFAASRHAGDDDVRWERLVSVLLGGLRA